MKIIKIHEGAEPLRWLLEEHAKLEHELGPIKSAKPADGLMTLKEAAAMPELGGVISIKTIRQAIGRGDIDAVQPSGQGGTVYVTRTAVLEWIEKCRVNQPLHASISELPASKTARSARMQPGSSSTEERKSALDAALRTARELKGR